MRLWFTKIKTQVLLGAALILGFAAVQGCAWAWQPTQPIELVVGAAPGGGLDVTARVIQRLWAQQAYVPTPVMVLNKPGAAQGIAWDYMNRKGKDGHVLSIGTSNLVSNPILGTHVIGYKDVTMVSVLYDDYIAFVVRADSPIRSMRDVGDRLQKDPTALTIAVAPALGGGPHIGTVAALKARGLSVKDVRFIVYKSTTGGMTALLGGDIDVVAASALNFPQHIESGRIRGIGVASPSRLGGAMAHLPTIKEQGIDATYTNWRGIVGAKGMRPQQIAYWEMALAKAVKTDDWQKALEQNFFISNFLTGDQARGYVERQAQEFRNIFSDLGLSKEP